MEWIAAFAAGVLLIIITNKLEKYSKKIEETYELVQHLEKRMDKILEMLDDLRNK